MAIAGSFLPYAPFLFIDEANSLSASQFKAIHVRDFEQPLVY